MDFNKLHTLMDYLELDSFKISYPDISYTRYKTKSTLRRSGEIVTELTTQEFGKLFSELSDRAKEKLFTDMLNEYSLRKLGFTI